MSLSESLRRMRASSVVAHRVDPIALRRNDGFQAPASSAFRRAGRRARGVFYGLGAAAPNGVAVAKGDGDLPPHNALRSCQITPEVNGCAVPLRAG